MKSIKKLFSKKKKNNNKNNNKVLEDPTINYDDSQEKQRLDQTRELSDVSMSNLEESEEEASETKTNKREEISSRIRLPLFLGPPESPSNAIKEQITPPNTPDRLIRIKKELGELNESKAAPSYINSREKEVIYLEELIKEREELGKLKKERTQFEEQEKEINYLEKRVQELTDLIRQKKEKIIGIFTRLLPEKEKEIKLIQSLVIAHLEFTKASKQKLPSVPLRRQRDKVRDELEVLLGNSLEEEIQLALTDCEELVSWELELEDRLKGKNNLIENQKQRLQITESSEEGAKLKEHEAIQQKQTQQAQWVINQLKKQLKARNQQVSAVLEYQIIEKQEQLNNLLAAVTLTPSAQEKISVVKEEIRVLQEELEKVGGKEQVQQILHQPYGIPGSSRN